MAKRREWRRELCQGNSQLILAYCCYLLQREQKATFLLRRATTMPFLFFFSHSQGPSKCLASVFRKRQVELGRSAQVTHV